MPGTVIFIPCYTQRTKRLGKWQTVVTQVSCTSQTTPKPLFQWLPSSTPTQERSPINKLDTTVFCGDESSGAAHKEQLKELPPWNKLHSDRGRAKQWLSSTHTGRCGSYNTSQWDHSATCCSQGAFPQRQGSPWHNTSHSSSTCQQPTDAREQLLSAEPPMAWFQNISWLKICPCKGNRYVLITRATHSLCH